MEDPSIDSIILSCNKKAMDHLREENYPACLHFLKRAQNLLDYPQPIADQSKLMAVTLNNLGCYYKKTGNLNLSLQYLTRALHLQQLTPSDRINLAGTHLNITTIRSSLNQHESALNHALSAINILIEAEALEPTLNLRRTLSIAYHNAGIEYDYIGNFQQARNLFAIGLSLAEKYIGNHPITTSLRASCSKFSNKKYYFDRTQSSGQTSTRSISSSQSKYSQDSAFPDIKRTVNRSLDFQEIQKPKKYIRKGKKPKSNLKNPSSLPPRSKTILNKRDYKSITNKLNSLQNQLEKFESQFLEKKNIESEGLDSPVQLSRPRSLKKNKAKSNRKATKIIVKTFKSFLCKEECLNLIERKYQDRVKPEISKALQPNKNVAPHFPKPHKSSRIPRPPSRFKDIDLEIIPEALSESNEGKILLIQANIRKFLIRTRYLKMREAAIKIQRYMKMHQVKNLYQGICDAIIFIQAIWRKYRKTKGNMIHKV